MLWCGSHWESNPGHLWDEPPVLCTELWQLDNHQLSQILHMAEVSWVWPLAAAGLFAFLYFHLITSEFLHFQREARCSEQQEIEWTSHWYKVELAMPSISPPPCILLLSPNTTSAGRSYSVGWSQKLQTSWVLLSKWWQQSKRSSLRSWSEDEIIALLW